MAGREGAAIVNISIYTWNIQSGDICVDEFNFLLLPVFIFSVKNDLKISIQCT
jgi:hypothetical protein